MNIPTNCREFSLDLARQSHPLVTRAGVPAKFIAYVPEANSNCKLVVSVNGQVVVGQSDGVLNSDAFDDLFLAPLGFCEGLPVFTGDVLLTKHGSKVTVNCDYNQPNVAWYAYSWPSKAPVVETKLSEEEIYDLYIKVSLDEDNSTTLRTVANKAIERAILDGDVIPTGCVLSLMYDAYNQRPESRDESFTDIAQSVLDNYLEGLK